MEDKKQLEALSLAPKKSKEEIRQELSTIIMEYEKITGVAITVSAITNVTRLDIVKATQQVQLEQQEAFHNSPNILLEAQYRLRKLKAEFEKACNESNEFYMNLLTEPYNE